MRRGEGFGLNFGRFDEAFADHQKPGSKPSDDWQTPPEIVKALGAFDLDPCASTVQVHRTAATMWNVDDGGFIRNWAGRVWLNPPYGRKTLDWVRRLGDHGNGIALVFARVDTPLFQDEIFVRASGVLFLRKRIFFIQRDGTRAKSSGGAPSVLVAYGAANMLALQRSGLKGSIVNLKLEGAMTRYARRQEIEDDRRGTPAPKYGRYRRQDRRLESEDQPESSLVSIDLRRFE